MIQHIIKLNHGSIDVQSEPNRGSCFTICLPPYIECKHADKAEQPAEAGILSAAAETTAKAAAADPGKSYHILLVDDVPEVLNIHKSLLSRIHHTTTTAQNGQQALELFVSGQHRFDMILTDYRMPVMNGLELVEAVRQYDQEIPILMITAFGEDENLQMAGSLGARLINKPIMLETLKNIIAEMGAGKTV